MNKAFFYPVLMVTSLAWLSSCDENAPQASDAAVEQPQPAEPAKPTAPTAEELTALLTEHLPSCDVAEVGTLSSECTEPAEDGSVSITAHIPLTLRENLYAEQSAPECFNEQRKAMNDAANAAVKPESVYLLQVGGTTDILTDADRAPKPLPEEMQKLANELKNLAESSVCVQQKAAGDTLELIARATARYEGEAWVLSDVTIDSSALQAIAELKPESAVQAAGIPVLTPEFEQARKDEIAAKLDAFNALAEPYINSREDNARATLARLQAEAEEAAHRANEEAAKAEATRQTWLNLCTKALTKGKNFSGEWTRDNQFGELTLHIETVKQFDNSIQFIGSIYDTKLPEASLDIAGRCELTPTEQGAKVDISIYDGRYDPDQPTAEVYDARDGLLALFLTQDGKLNGVMSCGAWANSPEKAFRISLTPRAEAAEKSSSRRRR